MRGLPLVAYFGVKEAVKALLQKRADADSKDGNGRTPLLWAAESFVAVEDYMRSPMVSISAV